MQLKISTLPFLLLLSSIVNNIFFTYFRFSISLSITSYIWHIMFGRSLENIVDAHKMEFITWWDSFSFDLKSPSDLRLIFDSFSFPCLLSFHSSLLQLLFEVRREKKIPWAIITRINLRIPLTFIEEYLPNYDRI